MASNLLLLYWGVLARGYCLCEVLILSLLRVLIKLSSVLLSSRGRSRQLLFALWQQSQRLRGYMKKWINPKCEPQKKSFCVFQTHSGYLQGLGAKERGSSRKGCRQEMMRFLRGACVFRGWSGLGLPGVSVRSKSSFRLMAFHTWKCRGLVGSLPLVVFWLSCCPWIACVKEGLWNCGHWILPEEKDGTWVEMVRWRGEANRRKHAAWTPRCFNRALQLQVTTLSRQAPIPMPIKHTGAEKNKTGWNGSVSLILISDSIL